jgi:hypothetical protein
MHAEERFPKVGNWIDVGPTGVCGLVAVKGKPVNLNGTIVYWLAKLDCRAMRSTCSPAQLTRQPTPQRPSEVSIMSSRR